jgi:hypothetical protein
MATAEGRRRIDGVTYSVLTGADLEESSRNDRPAHRQEVAIACVTIAAMGVTLPERPDGRN